MIAVIYQNALLKVQQRILRIWHLNPSPSSHHTWDGSLKRTSQGLPTRFSQSLTKYAWLCICLQWSRSTAKLGAAVYGWLAACVQPMTAQEQGVRLTCDHLLQLVPEALSADLRCESLSHLHGSTAPSHRVSGLTADVISDQRACSGVDKVPKLQYFLVNEQVQNLYYKILETSLIWHELKGSVEKSGVSTRSKPPHRQLASSARRS